MGLSNSKVSVTTFTQDGPIDHEEFRRQHNQQNHAPVGSTSEPVMKGPSEVGGVRRPKPKAQPTLQHEPGKTLASQEAERLRKANKKDLKDRNLN